MDEIDAHMHVDLQHRALPALIRLFPKVQFIVSSHSPLFVLGMEKYLRRGGHSDHRYAIGHTYSRRSLCRIRTCPPVVPRDESICRCHRSRVRHSGKALVLLEGETDPIYVRTAAALLGRQALLDKAEIEWVGAKDPKGGQAFHTGKEALNHTLSFLRAKPDLVKRVIILLYDNDSNKPVADYGELHVRSMPSNPANAKVQDGIENLLPGDVISDEMFDERRRDKRQADIQSIGP